MKTLKPYFILFLLLGPVSLHSQDISINLSIRWSKGPYILNTDSIVKYPELVVSYTNNSDKNLYFRKFSYYRDGIPEFYWVELISIYDPDHEKYKDYEKYLKHHKLYRQIINRALDKESYKNEKYVVKINLPTITNYDGWDVELENDNQGHQPNWINSDLRDINEYLNDSVYKNWSYQEIEITSSKSTYLSEEIITNDLQYQFMFLEAGETKKDVYNITCFDIVKGTYTYVLNGAYFDDKVFSGWDENGNKILLSLPEKVGEYRLYSGKFTSNSVTVKFE